MDLTIETAKKGKAVVLTVTGRLDAATAPEFITICDGLITAGDVSLIADLGKLDYISSAGLRSILATAKKLKGLQGQITFCNLTGMVKDVFNISGFTTMFTMYATLDEALAGC
jgi:anti-sigma B factor antagonist